MLFGAFPIVYRMGYGWNEGVSGLPFIGVAIGMIGAVAYTIFYDNKRYLRCMSRSGTSFAAPEDRLPPAMVGGAVLPIGLFWFAWTNYPTFHWAANVCAAIPFGFGMVLIFLSIMNYLIDAYTIFAASVLAGNGVLRSLFGAAFPLFTVQMYNNLGKLYSVLNPLVPKLTHSGIHWASAVPAFLALACLPFPFLLYKYGSNIRQKCKYAAQSAAFMAKIRNRGPQGPPKLQASVPVIDSSSVAHGEEEEVGQEAMDYSYEDENEPSFQEMRVGREKHDGLEKVRTGRSAMTSRSRRSARSVRTVDEEDFNPYDIDRVNTRDSFALVERSVSRAGSRNRPRSRTDGNAKLC